jgi:hypothetical protein
MPTVYICQWADCLQPHLYRGTWRLEKKKSIHHFVPPVECRPTVTIQLAIGALRSRAHARQTAIYSCVFEVLLVRPTMASYGANNFDELRPKC